jgi:pyruvate dehydrogenase E2 component (dihydrolipoamide acetyltransferase)
MSQSFNLPDLGEGIHEGEVLAVLVSVGDKVNEGDPILEVETDKAAVEIPSPYTSTVEEILVKPGDTVTVGEVLMRFAGGEEKRDEEPGEKPKEPAVSISEKAENEVTEKQAPATSKPSGPVPASPSTRRLARELGVDLHSVPSSGPAGLVTAEDVRAFAEGGKAAEAVSVSGEQAVGKARPVPTTVPPLPDFTRWGDVERVPLRSIRRATAVQMSLAWAQIPHVNNQDVVDMTKLEAFRSKHKKDIEARGGKLSPTVFALKAVATALKTYPNFNATLDTEAGEIILKHYYDIGVAVNTEDGLIVPVIREVDRKSIVELAVELKDLVERTRARKTTIEEMQGGTFTITNVGPMGGGHFSPIINYPQVAILGMGSTRLQPAVIENEQGESVIVPRPMMPVVLSIDHRVLDGADAIPFLKMIRESLEDPDELLMTMI